MDKLIIEGGVRLEGEIRIAGAKNSALPILAATLLTSDKVTICNLPHLFDITTMLERLGCMGVQPVIDEKLNVEVDSSMITDLSAPYELVKTMRASILVLGPLLAKHKRAEVALPGGCAIGSRPVNLHITALEAMGADIVVEDGYIKASVKDRLKGAHIFMDMVTVTGTENVMMAACLADGQTIIENAAREPELVDVIECLGKMGAQIDGGGSETITIQGVERLHGATHPVVTDRIELGTYMLAPVIAGGQVELLGGRINLLSAFCEKLDAIGVDVVETTGGLQVSRRSDVLKSVNVKTEVFPGFPTDLQAQMMALLCTAKGTRVLEETIFENRFMHAPELMRMGAQIDVQGGVAKVSGVDHLKGAPVMATDLRASVSLILAGLAAVGETVVSRVYHLDRGYEKLEAKLQAVGAKVERISS